MYLLYANNSTIQQCSNKILVREDNLNYDARKGSVIYSKNSFRSFSHSFKSFKKYLKTRWEPLIMSRNRLKLSTMFKIHNTDVPSYLKEMTSVIRNVTSDYNTRTPQAFLRKNFRAILQILRSITSLVKDF